MHCWKAWAGAQAHGDRPGGEGGPSPRGVGGGGGLAAAVAHAEQGRAAPHPHAPTANGKPSPPTHKCLSRATRRRHGNRWHQTPFHAPPPPAPTVCCRCAWRSARPHETRWPARRTRQSTPCPCRSHPRHLQEQEQQLASGRRRRACSGRRKAPGGGHWWRRLALRHPRPRSRGRPAAGRGDDGRGVAVAVCGCRSSYGWWGRALLGGVGLGMMAYNRGGPYAGHMLGVGFSMAMCRTVGRRRAVGSSGQPMHLQTACMHAHAVRILVHSN